MKKFILAVACIFTLGTSLSAQCPTKTDSTKKCVAAKTGATEQAHGAKCCSGKTKQCDCKEGAACSTPEGAKICAAHHAAAAQDSVKSCCKAENKHGKCGEKSCCKRDAVAPQDSSMSCCKADSKQAKMERRLAASVMPRRARRNPAANKSKPHPDSTSSP